MVEVFRLWETLEKEESEITMNIFKKCSICGEHFKLSKQDGESVLEKHLKDTHPKEYEMMWEAQRDYYIKLDELNITYKNRKAVTWFGIGTEGEWKKSQPVKPRPMDELLTLMRTGWEVGGYESWGGHHIAAQKGGLGKGGDAKYYSRSTIDALLKRGLIKYVELKSFPLQAKYVLTEKGKKGVCE